VSKGNLIDVFGNVVPPIALDQVGRDGHAAARWLGGGRMEDGMHCGGSSCAVGRSGAAYSLPLPPPCPPCALSPGLLSQLRAQGGGRAVCSAP
jgi:hypothetical protein